MIRLGFLLLTAGLVVLLPIVPRADSGWALLVPLLIAGSGLGLLVSQLNNYTLADLGGAGQRGRGGELRAGSFGLSFGLAFLSAIMLATLSITFTNMAEASDVLPPADQQQVADALEDDAELMSNTQLEGLLADEPEPIRTRSFASTPTRPLALQVALLIPILAGLVGLLNSFRMMRLPDPKPSSAVEVGSGLTRLRRQAGAQVLELGGREDTALVQLRQLAQRLGRVGGPWRRGRGRLALGA